jgi:hypothetical protein
MRRSSYLKRASRRFLEGTHYRSPVEAVEAGALNLNDWVRTLSEERDEERQYQEERVQLRPQVARGVLRTLRA